MAKKKTVEEYRQKIAASLEKNRQSGRDQNPNSQVRKSQDKCVSNHDHGCKFKDVRSFISFQAY